jgi:ABC-2 type transport system permease protein
MGASLHKIWALATKDIVDSLRNKTTLSVILGVVMVMLTGQALPMMLRLSSVPRVALYDAGATDLADALGDEAMRVIEAESPEELEAILTEVAEVALGMVVPADWSERPTADEPLRLVGYYPHWVAVDELAEIRALAEARLSEQLETPVQIITTGHAVYPSPTADGQPAMFTLSLVVALLTICVVVVPYLILEERETHTMDALLVSPASVAEVILGKALAGSVYGLAAGAVVLAFGADMVVHWGLALLGVIAGTLLGVSVGLLMGGLFENAQQMGLWLGLALLLLIAPPFLSDAAGAGWPPLVRAALAWLPSTGLTDLVRASLAGPVSIDDAALDLATIATASALILAAVAWQVRRADR